MAQNTPQHPRAQSEENLPIPPHVVLSRRATELMTGDQPRRSSAIVVYVVMYGSINPEDWTPISIGRIARSAGMSRKTVMEAISTLERHCLIERRRCYSADGGAVASEYRLGGDA